MVVLPEERLKFSELSEIREVAGKIFQICKDTKVWAFEGEMGAGKTTLIKSLCEVAGVSDNVTSPTFSLVNEYRTADDKVFYHFDFYRIKDESEAMDIGVEEYFYSGDYCFVEWPSKIESLLPSEHVLIKITVEDNYRLIDIYINKSTN